MIHYSCDRCQRLIEADDEVRYVVRLDVEAKLGENVFARDDEDSDHLLEIHEILERSEAEGDSKLGQEIFARKRFDLCAECYETFQRNPIGREIAKSAGFSQN